MSLDDAIEAEALAQAVCMQTQDFRRAYEAFVAKAETAVCRKLTMLDRSFLRWPFFEERHRALADQLETWAAQHCAHVDHRDVDAACRELVRNLGRDGWLKHTAPGEATVGQDRRSHAGLGPRNAGASFRPRRFRLRDAGPWRRSDFAVRHARSKRRAGCRRPAAARRSRRLRLSEPASGSDVANISMTARRRRRRLSLSTARRHGSRTAASPIFMWSSPAPARRQARRACRPSSCAATIPACRSPSVSR